MRSSRIVRGGQFHRILREVPALPEIATQGETVEEALANAKDAIELVLADRAATREEIPESDTDARIERITVAL